MTLLSAHPVVVRRPPWRLVVPAALAAAGMLVPLVYLLLRASQADRELLREAVLRWKTVEQLLNTLGLAAAVLVCVTLLALPLAWLTTRAELRLGRAWTLLCVMPLAIPGYLTAYALLAMGGAYGTVARLTGVQFPVLKGFWGALLALSLYNLPYMFLNLRVAMQRLDPALEEAARSLGHSPLRVFASVTLPQLRPALWAGGLLVALHVIGDFGVVSLMRFETFSYAIFMQFQNQQIPAAACLGLFLLLLTAVVLLFEWRFLRGLRLDPAGMSTPRVRRPVSLGRWAWPAYALLGVIVFCSLVAPLSTIVYQLTRDGAIGVGFWTGWRTAVWDTARGALPAAILTTLLAIPVAYLARRYPSNVSRGIERSVYIGYATPPVAFALGWVFFSLILFGRDSGVYQSLGLLVVAYSLHFLAEAVGPVRSSLFVATPRVEEASRSLGCGRAATFFRVTLPLLRPGITASMALVFMSVVKELPLTFILAPLDFQSLAMRVWNYTEEAMYPEAAPYALTILLASAAFVGLLLRGQEQQT